MSARRSNIEVIHDMLNSIRQKGGAIKPTHLMYKANLSHQQMKLYIEQLMTKDLIEEQMQANKKQIALTDKGYQFLSEYRKMKEFIDAFGL